MRHFSGELHNDLWVDITCYNEVLCDFLSNYLKSLLVVSKIDPTICCDEHRTAIFFYFFNESFSLAVCEADFATFLQF